MAEEASYSSASRELSAILKRWNSAVEEVYVSICTFVLVKQVLLYKKSMHCCTSKAPAVEAVYAAAYAVGAKVRRAARDAGRDAGQVVAP